MTSHILDCRDKTVERTGPAKCPVCGSSKYSESDIFETLVGYGKTIVDGTPHNHDDNCRKAGARCENGHDFVVRYQNFCPDCDWVGKTKCFCDTDQTVVIRKEDRQ